MIKFRYRISLCWEVMLPLVYMILSHSNFCESGDWAREQHTLFKTDSIRAGCFACQNKNPRNIRWKISFSGFMTTFCKTLSSEFLTLALGFPNCPAELSSTTPATCSGNPPADTKAVNPPRLYIYKNSHLCEKTSYCEKSKSKLCLVMEILLKMCLVHHFQSINFRILFTKLSL